jgi:hypothetical protein
MLGSMISEPKPEEMKKGLYFTALALAMSLESCVPTSIISKKSPDFNKEISRIYILVDGSDRAEEYFKSLGRHLFIHLISHEIETEIHVFDPLSLETDKEVFTKVGKFHPDAIMTIQMTEGWSRGWTLYGLSGATLDLKILDPSAETIFWRASFRVYSSLLLENTSKTSAKRIVSKLLDDNVLNCNITTQSK